MAGMAKGESRRPENFKCYNIPNFKVLLTRWIAEHTTAYIMLCRNLGRDFERHVRDVVGCRTLNMIKTALRRYVTSPS
jgi:hypothetical protein